MLTMTSRVAALCAFAVTLAGGCERPSATAPEQKPAATAAPVLGAPQGRFTAISNTAMGVTGDMTIAGSVLTFAKGPIYALADGRALRGADAYAASGDTFASLLNAPAEAELKLFRALTTGGPAPAQDLCGQTPAAWIVLYEAGDVGGAPSVFLAPFSGANPPGPTGVETALCGTFMYAPAAE